MKSISVLSLLCLLAVVARPISAQETGAQATGTITGVVTGDGGQPLEGADVRVAGTELASLAGAGGRYTIADVPAGSHTVRASFLGYGEAERTAAVTAGEATTLDVELVAQALALDRKSVV